MSKKNRLLPLLETALIASFAMSLSLIPDFASWFSPSFGAIPLIIFSLRRGVKFGFLAGLIWGSLHFVLGKVYYLSLSQVIIEYLLAFLVMGASGLFAQSYQQSLKNQQINKAIFLAILGSLLAVILRYTFHFIAGIIFWGNYAPKGISPFLYSLTVNGIAGLLTLSFVIISVIIITKKFSKIILS